MNITELLSKELDTESKQICLNITTITDIYTFCFIEYEDCEKIGVYITGEDGRERYLIIIKDQIVAVQVVYEQDIQIKEKTGDVMVQ